MPDLAGLSLTTSAAEPPHAKWGPFHAIGFTHRKRSVFPAIVSAIGSIEPDVNASSHRMFTAARALFYPSPSADHKYVEAVRDAVLKPFLEAIEVRTMPKEGLENAEPAFYIGEEWRHQRAYYLTYYPKLLLSKLQSELTIVRPPKVVRAEPVGMGVVSGGEIVERPSHTVRVGSFEVRDRLQGEFVPRKDRLVGAKYHALLAAALRHFAESEAKRGNGLVELNDADYLALAATFLAAYGRADNDVDTEERYAIDDPALERVREFLGLPGTLMQPCALPTAGKVDVGRWKDILALNMVLGFCAQRCGPFIGPLDYEWKKGNIMAAKMFVGSVKVAPLDFGSGSDLWVHPARTNSLSDAIELPMAFGTGGTNNWEIEDPETLSATDITVVSGRISVPEEGIEQDVLRLLGAKEAFVGTRRIGQHKFGTIDVPTGPDTKRRPVVMLIGYLMDASTGPRYAKMLGASLLVPALATVVSRNSLISQTGGVIPEDGGSLVGGRRTAEDRVKATPIKDQQGAPVEEKPPEAVPENAPESVHPTSIPEGEQGQSGE